MDRRPAPLPIRRSRAAFAALLTAFVAAAAACMVSGDWSVVRALGVPTMDLPWFDARTISGASVALEQCLDPLVDNPGDPEGRAMNYPRVWLLFAWLGGGPAQTWALAWLFFAALAFALPTLLPLARTPLAALALTLSLFAPTTWLALERANSDLMMFALCACAARLAAVRPLLAALLVQVAAALKLYPVAAISALFGRGAAGNRALACGAVALFALYVVVTRDDVALIHAGAARAEWLAYGVATLPELLAKNAPVPAAAALGVGAAALLAVAALAARARARTRLGAAGTPHSLAAFRVGAAVYLGSFVIGNSFDYRLLFLLLTLPQLALWTTAAAPRLRALARAQLAMALLLQWSMTWRAALGGVEASAGFLIDEVLSWLTWAGYAWFFAQTLPQWMVPQWMVPQWMVPQWMVPARRRPAFLDEQRPVELAPSPARVRSSRPGRERMPGA